MINSKAMLVYCLVVGVFTGFGVGLVFIGEGWVGWVLLWLGLTCAVTGARTLVNEARRSRREADGTR